jgi:PAS domain S-box-containing protein
MSGSEKRGLKNDPAALSNSPLDYRRILESTPALFLVLAKDTEFTILEASDAFLLATFTQHETIVGRGLFDVFPDNPGEQNATGTKNLRASLERVLASKSADAMAVQKYDIRRPESEGGGFVERYWSRLNSPVISDAGDVLYIVHRVEDVTEFVKAKQSPEQHNDAMRLEVLQRSRELDEANRQLREANEQFQAIYEQGLFAARLNLDGTVIDVNRACVETCGFQRANIIGRPFWECGWWNRSSEVQDWVRQAVMQAVSGKPFRGESRYFWADGSEHIVDFACMPIKDASGRAIVVVPTGMDITERVRSEENRRALEQERDRARALADIDRAKTTFFSNVSHEFRTPLTLMIGPLQDALSQPTQLADTVRDDLSVALRNSLRLLKLVNTLLDFARIEAARAQPNFQPVDLARLTCGIASAFQPAVERARLRLVLDCHPLDEPAYVDGEMWEKIVLNLVSNAFKYTFEGEIGVHLGRAGNVAELTVRDTGTGIPAAELPRLFERFHRVQGARARTHEGSGIGLALVRELVRLHGGEIRVESKLDHGTTFVVTIPLGKEHLPSDRIAAPSSLASTMIGAAPFVEEALRWFPDAPPPDPASILEMEGLGPEQPGTPSQKARVLIADDNQDMREYLRRLLAPRYDVETVSDGRAALQAARGNKPDLILTDVMMPRLDGFGLLREVRQDAALEGIPVIMISARAGEEARVEGVEASADDYIVKPFSARELVARVDAQIETSRVRRKSSADLEEVNARLRREIEYRKASSIVEARLGAIIESSDDAIVSKTLDGIITSWNAGAEALFGYTAAEAVRKSILLIVPAERHGEEADILRRLRNGERINHFETQRLAKDGRLVDISLSVSPIRDSTGTIVGASKIARDIRDKKRIEREREHLLDAERHARAEAQRVNQLKDEFLATLSHELRTPLNAIMGWAQLMGLGSMNEDEMREAGRAIERNARTQKQLIEDLLDMSRIISGKLRLDVQQLEPVSVV